MIHPAEREAERLRVIIATLAETAPDMTMHVAGDVIFKIEKQTAELEAQQVAVPSTDPKQFILPARDAETIAKYIDLRPEIQALVPHKMINAIKEVRSECTFIGAPPHPVDPSRTSSIGLKEAKDGVEHWRATRIAGTATPTPAPVSPRKWTLDPKSICAWIDSTANGARVARAYDSSPSGGKIHAIKECRATHPAGPSLKEAKDGVETWISVYR